ncbi:hypothetical protein N4627_02830 [Limosilactobacillus vaginalis]|uniref:hypothetical protein n=1 Tax=Limosilactobacillus vaginalis TaxID=1633 RepID=UPI0021B68BC7|nr:hypothetical protein [Limosilactobacillus vaginalis]UXC69702.1 hypothetical protein N4627_02830 [Limosilactobacillus vaginalis]
MDQLRAIKPWMHLFWKILAVLETIIILLLLAFLGDFGSLVQNILSSILITLFLLVLSIMISIIFYEIKQHKGKHEEQ